MKVDTGETVWVNEDSEDRYCRLNRPPSDLTAAESVSSQPGDVDTSVKIERACEAPITNIG